MSWRKLDNAPAARWAVSPGGTTARREGRGPPGVREFQRDPGPSRFIILLCIVPLALRMLATRLSELSHLVFPSGVAAASDHRAMTQSGRAEESIPGLTLRSILDRKSLFL